METIKSASNPGHKRFIIINIDDYSRLGSAYSIKTKDEAGIYLKRLLRSARILLGKDEKVCCIRSDQGKELRRGKILEIIDKKGIEAEFSPVYTPEHKNTVERFNRTLQKNNNRVLMFDSGLPKSMWKFTAEGAIYICYRAPRKSIDFKTPLQKFALEKK